MMKKLVALLMALALLCTSIGAFATDEDETSVESSAVTYKYNIPDEDDSTHVHTANDSDKIGAEVVGNCLEGTYQEYVCHTPNCPTGGKFKVYSVAPAAEHKSVISKIDPEATCTEDGVNNFECTACGAKWTETVPATDHTWVVKKTADGKDDIVLPTCTGYGYTNYVCTAGDAEEKRNFVPPTGHIWKLAEGYSEGPEFTPAEDVDQVDEIPEAYLLTQFDPQDCVTGGQLVKFAICEVCGRRVVEKSVEMTALNHQAWLDEYTAHEIDLATNEEETEAKYIERMLSAFNVPADAKTFEDTIPGAPFINIEGESDLDAHYGDLKVTYVAPGCTTEGSLTVKCTTEKCDAHFDLTIPATGHDLYVDPDNGVKEMPANCEESGWLLVECRECDFSEKVPVSGTGVHTPAEQSEWTYTQKKYGALASASLNNEKATQEKPLVDCQPYTVHIPCKGFDVTVTLSDGTTFTTHLDCDEVTTSNEPAKTTEHNKDPNTRYYKEAECEVPGYDYYYCLDCGTSEGSGTLAPLEHDSDKEAVIKAADCVNPGTMGIYCSKCDVLRDTRTIPPTGHKWTEYQTTPATCTTDGRTYRVCLICGEEESEKIAAHHTAPTAEQFKELIKQDPTNYSYTPNSCTADGYQSYICQNPDCQAKVTNELIPMTGHSWTTEEYLADKDNLAYCAENGQYYDDIEPATCLTKAYYYRYCTNEGCPYNTEPDKYYIEGSELPHNIGKLILDTTNLPTCTSAGKAFFQCGTEGCDFRGIIDLPALPHNESVEWNSETKAYEVTCVEINAADSMTEHLFDKGYLKDVFAAAYADEDDAEVARYEILSQMAPVLVGEKAIGCGTLEAVKVAETHYEPAIDAKDGYVTLTPDANCALLEKPYITVLWTLQNAEGSVLSFGHSFNSYTKEGNNLVFDIGVCDAPGYDLVSIVVVVTDSRQNTIKGAVKSSYGDATYTVE